MDNPERHSERRSQERYQLKLDFNLVNQGSGRVIGKLADISEQGMMVISSERFYPDTIYQVQLEAVGESSRIPSLSLGLDCMWAIEREQDSGCWAGFRIIDISDQGLEQIRELIETFGRAE